MRLKGYIKHIAILFMIIYCTGICVLGEALALSGSERKNAVYDTKKRDPFIPIVKAEGDFRRSFIKPIATETITLPTITLMGISKVGNVYYALIDGEMIKQGDIYKGLLIDYIDTYGIKIIFRNKEFVVNLETENN